MTRTLITYTAENGSGAAIVTDWLVVVVVVDPSVSPCLLPPSFHPSLPPSPRFDRLGQAVTICACIPMKLNQPLISGSFCLQRLYVCIYCATRLPRRRLSATGTAGRKDSGRKTRLIVQVFITSPQ